MENEAKEMLFAEERKSQILKLLKENSKLLVPDLCQFFNVSPATIRNDLRELASVGLLKRTHGGAISNEKKAFELSTVQKSVKSISEKKAIAEFAAAMVEPGDTIALDTGTTTMELARKLAKIEDLTVVVNDIEIAAYLEEHSKANIVLIGGLVRRNFHCTIGPTAVNSLSGLSVDKVFVAVNGISVKKGLTTPDINQAEVKKAMMDIASQVIVVCDSSKIENVSFVRFAPISKVDYLITDHKISESDLEELKEKGIKVEVVNV